jgi:cysteine desulfurase family protein
MIYFDSAATSFQKPRQVPEAVSRAMRSCASAGRGGHSAGIAASNTLFSAREELQSFFNASTPEQIIFTFNATHAINIAVKGLTPVNGTVLCSALEHNAAVRPLYAAEEHGIQLRIVESPLFSPDETLENWRRALEDGKADAAVVNHVSNVFGSVAPVEKIAVLCKQYGVPLIIDAAQSAGHLPINCGGISNAVVCTAGHKGLYGPQGTGVMILPDGLLPHPLMEGGTGNHSLSRAMPDDIPDRYEAGTHNIPGIAGLTEGVRFAASKGIPFIRQHERQLTKLLCNGLTELPGITVYSAENENDQIGVVSFTVSEIDSESVAERLAERDIAVRAGYHCAPLAHQTAGTLPGGTIRVSFSLFNTPQQVGEFLRVLRKVIQ